MDQTKKQYNDRVWAVFTSEERDKVYKYNKSLVEQNTLRWMAERDEVKKPQVTITTTPQIAQPEVKRRERTGLTPRTIPQCRGKFSYRGKVFDSLKKFCELYKVDYPKAKGFWLEGHTAEDTIRLAKGAMVEVDNGNGEG